MSESCGEWCYLAEDVIAAVFAPQEAPRKLTCTVAHPHDGPHEAEGWQWRDGAIWRAGLGNDESLESPQ